MLLNFACFYAILSVSGNDEENKEMKKAKREAEVDTVCPDYPETLIYQSFFDNIHPFGETIMQNIRKIIPVFLFGSFLIIGLLFCSIWRILLEDSPPAISVATPAAELTPHPSKIDDSAVFCASQNELLRFQADMMKRKYPHFARVVQAVFQKSRIHGINPNLLMSIIETESAFNPYAVSSAGAYGLMQINYSIWKEKLAIDHQRIFDINYNLDLGIKILQHYIKIANNDIEKALYYYNNGFTLENYGYVDKVTPTVFY